MDGNEKSICLGCMSPKEYDGPCKICGYEGGGATNPDYLPPDTMLETRYLVGKLLFSNKESTYYIGFDTQEDVKVFIREFYPDLIATRNHANMQLKPLKDCETTYKRVMAEFEDLCLRLKGISGIRGITQVLDVFEENNTVYAVFRYLNTIPLADLISRCGGEIKWANCRKMFLALLNTVSFVHKKGIIHAGISPQTILIDEAGNPYLSMFSINEERALGSELEGELFDGYSAPEQYDSNNCYGEWTDVYAIAAVMYRTVTGTMPPVARDRKISDNLVHAVELDSSIPQNVSDAIRNAMLLPTEGRIRTADVLSARLLDNVESNTAIYHTDSDIGIAPSAGAALQGRGGRTLGNVPEAASAGVKKRRKLRVFFSVVLTTLLTAALLAALMWFLLRDSLGFIGLGPENPDPSSSQSEPPPGSETDADVPKVPDFTGKYIDAISSGDGSADYSLWFDISTQYDYNDKYANGVVYDQSPPVGTPMPNRGNVILKVSKGPNTVNLPDLTGSTLELAIKQLTDLELPYKVIYVSSDEYIEGVVAMTTPSAGSEVRKNEDEILLVVKRVEESSSETLSPSSEESSSNPYKTSKPTSSTPKARKKEVSSRQRED